MAGTTTNYGFPYPESSDLVANYPALGQNLAEEIDDIFGAYTAFTPVVTGTGWALGDAQLLGVRSNKIGKNVLYRGFIKFGSTSTYGAGHLTLSLPVSVKVVSGTYVGTPYVEFRDVSTNERFTGVIRFTSTTTMALYYVVSGTRGQIGALDSTNPFTWANGDEIEWAVIYEAA